VIAGTLTAENDTLWYRFTPEKDGFYRFRITGNDIIVNTYEGGELFSYDPFTSDEAINIDLYSKGDTYCVEVHGTGDFAILIEPQTIWEVFQLLGAEYAKTGISIDELSSLWGTIKENLEKMGAMFVGFGPIGILALIGMLPVFGVMLGFFFAPFSVGGTLIISLISALFLPITLLLSPFILMQYTTDMFNLF
jgi:sensor histidine kinase YesM